MARRRSIPLLARVVFFFLCLGALSAVVVAFWEVAKRRTGN